MTGNLEMLMNMHKAQVIQDANIRAAEDIGKKAALGYFDVEFTMYGCAYFNNKMEKMSYRVSDKADDIYNFVEVAPREELYPGNVETMTLKCPVPLGTKELIARDVKKELAKELNTIYCKDFFVELYQLAQEIQSNQAAKQLWEEAERLEGTFDEEKLRQFATLVHYYYSCRTLTNAAYQELQAWIAEERKSTEEDFVSKDIFEKTMYGFAYRNAGKLHYISNAQSAYVFAKAYELEQKGISLTPIYDKTYWYNYVYRLADVVQDYKTALKNVCNQEHFDKLQRMKGTRDEEQRKHFRRKLEVVSEQYGKNAAATIERYGYHWGVL